MRLKNLIPTAAKLQLYKSAKLPHLTYYHLTWHFFVGKVTGGNWSAFKKAGLGRYSMANNLVMKNCWYTTDVGIQQTSLYNRRIQDISILIYKVKFLNFKNFYHRESLTYLH